MLLLKKLLGRPSIRFHNSRKIPSGKQDTQQERVITMSAPSWLLAVALQALVRRLNYWIKTKQFCLSIAIAKINLAECILLILLCSALMVLKIANSWHWTIGLRRPSFPQMKNKISMANNGHTLISSVIKKMFTTG